MPVTLKITVEHHALDQCQIFVAGKRVGYVCYGPGKPINWLAPQTIGMTLTAEEKIAIATDVRAQMATLNADRDAQAAELARLEMGDGAFLGLPPAAATAATAARLAGQEGLAARLDQAIEDAADDVTADAGDHVPSYDGTVAEVTPANEPVPGEA